jgi:pimeloyl-ACP methyl ester carboxylesterase
VEFVETRHGRAAFDAAGEGNPVIMFHGGGVDRRCYDELRARLPAGYRSFAVDWPGHGDSGPFQGTATAWALADAAQDVVAALAPSGALLVGNSVGGFAAARLALTRPELVRGVVIADGGGFSGFGPQVKAFCALMAQPWFLRACWPAFLRFALRDHSAAAAQCVDAGRRITRSREGARLLASLWRSFAQPGHDLRTGASAITVPTLLVWGRYDRVIPLRDGRKAAALVPGSRLMVFDTGHVPFLSDPEGVAAALIPFAEAAFGHVVPAD